MFSELREWGGFDAITDLINGTGMFAPEDSMLSDFSSGFLAGALADDNCEESFEDIDQIIRDCF